MSRRNNRPLLKKSEIFVILMFLALGFMVPTAYGSLLNAPAPTAQGNPSLDATMVQAEAACALMRSVNGVQECHVMDFTSFDVIIPGVKMDMARKFCQDAAQAISERFPRVSGKTYKVRVAFSGLVPTQAACRVPPFSS